MARVKHSGDGSLSDTRNFYGLQPGDRFKAMIMDIKPGHVTIRLDDGSSFTARTMVLPEARIGEESIFAVRDNNFKGQITLEMLKLDPTVKQGNAVRDALRHAGLFVNDENLALGMAMIQHNLPVDAATLQKAAFFRFAKTSMPLDRVLFLLRENLPADNKSVSALNIILDRPSYLAETLTTLSEQIITTESAHRADLLSTILPGDTSADADALRKHLFLSLSGQEAAGVLPRYYNGLLHAVLKSSEAASRLGEKKISVLSADILESLRFMKQLSRRREYYQIPYITEPHTQTGLAELHIFKDAGQDLSREARFMLTTETTSLGRVEVYAQKSEHRLHVQFRGSDGGLRTINASTAALTQALKQKGIAITGYDFQKSTEAFTLLSPEPGKDGESKKNEAAPKRFTFDMRV